MFGDEIYDKACEELEQGKQESGVKKLVLLAENGNVKAMERLAFLYSIGEGVELDTQKSIRWDLKAIDNGSVISLGNVAITYKSIGNIHEAEKWFKKAISAGDDDASLELAKLYMDSEKKNGNIKKLLQNVISGNNVCLDSINEAKELLKSMK